MNPKHALMVAAGIATFGAIIHVIAPLFGPDWYAYWGAPIQVVESARAGTWLAPVSAAAIGLAMQLAGLYALSAAGSMRRLPLLKPAMVTLSFLCTVRGLLVIPALMMAPQLLTTFDVVASLVWLLAGLGFLYGSIRLWPALGKPLHS